MSTSNNETQYLLNENRDETPHAVAYILAGSLIGLFLGTIVGNILDAIFAEYRNVVCTAPGHEDGGTHHDGDHEWTHDGPTYKVPETEGDAMWYLGSSLAGMGLGIIVALVIMVHQRAQQQSTSMFGYVTNYCSSMFRWNTNAIENNRIQNQAGQSPVNR